MLMPKRVKYRKQQRGRIKGYAHKGNKVTYGEYGLQALEPAWITSQQIEAARVAMTRFIKRGGKVKPGRVMFELAGVSEEIAKEAMTLASHKLPIKTRIVKRLELGGDLNEA